jgi:ATPase family associated with various cellular activities (AAA)/Winged helix domain, variant
MQRTADFMTTNHQPLETDMADVSSSNNGLEPALIKLRHLLHRHIQENHPDIDLPELKPLKDNNPASLPPRFQQLAARFSLSPLEINILLFCLGSELDPMLPILYKHVLGVFYPTVTLVRNLSPEVKGTLPPQSPLRFWELVSMKDPLCYLHTPVTTPERVIQFLLDSDNIDEELIHVLREIETGTPITGTHLLFKQISQDWINPQTQQNPVPLQLQHWDADECEQAASYMGGKMGLRLFAFRLEDLPDTTRSERFFKLLGRELILSNAIIYVDCSALDNSKLDPVTYNIMQAFIKKLTRWFPTRVIFSAETSLLQHDCNVQPVILPDRSVTEQCEVWQKELNLQERIPLNGLKRISEQFRLSLKQTRVIAQQWNKRISADIEPKEGFNLLWSLCRWNLKRIVPNQLNIIKAKAGMDDLVLTTRCRYLLSQFLAQAQHRYKVYEDWGFAEKSQRGLGLVALFSGHPGTGKTTAAEVIANELNLDLVQVNLSQTVSKYIGETEKNLEEAFNFADRSGAILLFDEADSIFSKRSNVNDSHDHYANQQVSYLLQKIETYRGVTILTTNFQKAIDQAFLRRIRFVIPFQLPGMEERFLIWKQVFPEILPKAGLDFAELSRFNLSGGEIRSSALNAAFLAAHKDTQMEMPLLDEAIQEEFKKNEKPLSKD